MKNVLYYNMRVGLVFGGNTTEGEVSKKSAESIRGALLKLGYEVIDIEFDKNIAIHIQDANVDVVFNAMHGQYGEDGCLQGLLNILQIPYTHSGVFSSAVGMNKQICKTIFKGLGLKVPRGIVVKKEDLSNDKWKDILKKSELKDCKEVFIKPVCDGSSRDAFLVHNVDEYSFKTIDLNSASKEFLIEERIIGREIQAVVFRDKAIGLLEVCPNGEFYDYKSKYTEGGAVHKKVDFSEDLQKKILKDAEKIHNSLCLKDISRSEFLLTKDNEIYALEVNTHPGFTNLSIVPEVALNAGISYEEIIDYLVKNANIG